MKGVKIGSLCTGYGGLDEAAQWVWGGEILWCADNAPGPSVVIERDFPGVPNLGDVKEIEWGSLPAVDILTAGYPCTPFSSAGPMLVREDDRFIWPHIYSGIMILRPAVVFLENVSNHRSYGFDGVVGDLHRIGYSISWGVYSSSEIGAPHRRLRLFVVAARRSIRVPDGPPFTRLERKTTPLLRTPVAGDWGHGPSNKRRWISDDCRYAYERGNWGRFSKAISEWETITGEPCPDPMVVGSRGVIVLNSELSEWAMGLEPGHVTSAPMSRKETFITIGNGVVPQCGSLALWELAKDL